MKFHCQKCFEPQEAPHRYVACRYCGDRNGRGLSIKPTRAETTLLKPRVKRGPATALQKCMLRGAKGEGRPLSIWLARRKSTKSAFAEEMGVTRQTVDNWLKRGRAWSVPANRIYDLMIAEGVRPALLHKSTEVRWEERLDEEAHDRT